MREAGSGVATTSQAVRFLLRLISKLVNAYRLRGMVVHRTNRRQAQRVLRAVRAFEEPGIAARCLCYLRQVDPLVFEEVVMSAIEDAGFFVLRSRSYSGDGGIDGAFWSPQLGWYAVQAKRYRTHINRQHVQDFGEAIRRQRYDGGVFVHTGRSGAGVYPELRDAGLGLLSGQRLVELVLEKRLAVGACRGHVQFTRFGMNG